MGGPLVRSAKVEDLADLVRIYNHYITSTHVTFDTEPFTIAERLSWFQGFSCDGPHRLLVAEVEARPVGYASSTSFRAKPAYSTSVETTIYLDPDAVGRGIGRVLYRALLTTLEGEEELHRAFAGIAVPNPSSIALHRSLGFQAVGTFRQVGRKFDRFWDVSWYGRDLFDPGPGARCSGDEDHE